MVLQDLLLLLSLSLFFCSLVLHFFHEKTSLALIILFLSTLIVRVDFARIDPFLHVWDEKFHTLVARNMISHPLVPKLKPEAMYTELPLAWCCNHIWLHKQPLFLWQAAISLSLFGISELSLRLPRVLMGALMVPMIYRLGFRLTGGVHTAFLAAALFSFSHFQLTLISGWQGMDHNDMAFCFYVLASIIAYIEYQHKPHGVKALLIGLWAGCAVLNKWLTGLLVYAAWGIEAILASKMGKGRREWKHPGASLLICLLVFLPWQIYIFREFPDLAYYEYQYNARHLFEPIEGHRGEAGFYLNRFPLYFGSYIW